MIKYLLIFTVFITGIWLTYTITPRPYQVHYHANMGVYIDGKAWDFGKDIYMEEVSRCNVTVGVKPEDRIHLHENKGDLVHVHMAAATWGDLYSNLMWNFGSGYLVDDYGKMYIPTIEKHLYFILNGKEVNNPHNIPVKSEDRLLIWYGTGDIDTVVTKYYPLVSNTAHEYNTKADPASCSTNEQSEVGTLLWQNFKELFFHHHD